MAISGLKILTLPPNSSPARVLNHNNQVVNHLNSSILATQVSLLQRIPDHRLRRNNCILNSRKSPKSIRQPQYVLYPQKRDFAAFPGRLLPMKVQVFAYASHNGALDIRYLADFRYNLKWILSKLAFGVRNRSHVLRQLTGYAGPYFRGSIKSKFQILCIMISDIFFNGIFSKMVFRGI